MSTQQLTASFANKVALNASNVNQTAIDKEVDLCVQKLLPLVDIASVRGKFSIGEDLRYHSSMFEFHQNTVDAFNIGVENALKKLGYTISRRAHDIVIDWTHPNV